MNGLLIWLANGKVQLKAQLQTLSSRAQETAKNLWGQYKRKGTKQSRCMEQHHAKLAKDSFAKAWAAGYGDLENMFLMRKEPVERVDSGENLVLDNDGERVVGVESDQGSMMDPEEWNDLNNWQEEMLMDPDGWDNEMSGNSCGEEAVDRWMNVDNALQEINVNSNTNNNECGLGNLPDIIPPSGTAADLEWEPYIASHTYFFLHHLPKSTSACR